MPERILQEALSGQLALDRLLVWLQGENVEGGGEECPLRGCGRSEFAAYVLSFVRNQTDRVVQRGGSRPAAASTPAAGRVHRRSVSDPTEPGGAPSPTPEHRHNRRKVKTKLFTDDRSRDSLKEPSSDESRLSGGVERLQLSSTPLRGDRACTPDFPSPVPDTPRSRHSRAPDTTLGDYLTPAHKSTKKKKTKHTCDDSEVKTELDISSSEAFPEIGARKASSLRAERRRIKPTNIDLTKKSISLNSFNSEEFQRPSPLALEDNAAFASSPGAESFGTPNYSAERAVLKRERRRLMEKFQSISAASSPRVLTPTFKLTPADRSGEYITADPTKVTFEDKLEILAKIYDALLENNLIVSYPTELYFLMSLVLARTEENTPLISADDLLTSVHNCGYFGARVLWLQRSVLVQLLDEGTLRALGESKSVRALSPELAKCLLNAYGVRRETPPPRSPRVAGCSGGVVQWNAETDNADNFPSTMSFQCFKKQRDMFYEIVRWYWETGGGCATGGAGGGVSLRTRVRALLAAGGAHGTHAHLGLLIARHAKAASLGGGGGAEDSRLSKLQRRLTRPGADPLSLYTPEEELYREILSSSESEPFRAAVRDALATELRALDAAPLTGGAAYNLVRASRSLGKLLGLLAALPYAPSPPPHEGALRHSLALRTYWQPPLDVYAMLAEAAPRGRLTVTLPWVCAWLAALDRTALSLPYTTRVLLLVRALLRGRLSPRCEGVSSVNKLFLRCTVGWLFARPHVPQEVLYSECAEVEAEAAAAADSGPVDGPDGSDLLSAHEVGLLLPVRREAALAVSGAGWGAGGDARHVTPLRLAPSRDNHLQRRLSGALRTSIGGGARRVLELAAERVGTRALHELGSALAEHPAGQHKCTPESLAAISAIGPAAQTRAAAAVAALAEGGASRAVAALAARAVRTRLAKHAHPHLAPGALCEPAAAALRALVCEPWRGVDPIPAPSTAPPRAAPPPSAAETILRLKEAVCVALEGGVCANEAATSLCAAVSACGGAGRTAKRALVMLALDLCVALACRRPAESREEVFQAAERVWSACIGPRPVSPPPSPPPAADRGEGGSRAPTPDSDGEPGAPPRIVIAPLAEPPQNNSAASASDNGVATATAGPEAEEELVAVLERAACPRNIRLLEAAIGGEQEMVVAGRALGELFSRLVTHGWVTSRALTERCVALYRPHYPQALLPALSACVRAVSAGCERGEGGERGAGDGLLLDFLAEYCADMQPPADQHEM